MIMKIRKWIPVCLSAMALALPAAAGEKAPELVDYSCVQLLIWENVPGGARNVPVSGVRGGAPFSGADAPVYGAEVAVLGAMTGEVDGFLGSLITAIGRKINGLQLSLVNLAEQVNGLQLGIYNQSKDSSLQLGLINYMEDSPCPVLPFFNCKF